MSQLCNTVQSVLSTRSTHFESPGTITCTHLIRVSFRKAYVCYHGDNDDNTAIGDGLWYSTKVTAAGLAAGVEADKAVH